MSQRGPQVYARVLCQRNTSAEYSATAAASERGELALGVLSSVLGGFSEGTFGGFGRSELAWVACRQVGRVDKPSTDDDKDEPWVASWVDWSSLSRPLSYASYPIPLKSSSYGHGTAVNSRLSSLPYSSPSSKASSTSCATLFIRLLEAFW
jgi:hypothetical protein